MARTRTLLSIFAAGTILSLGSFAQAQTSAPAAKSMRDGVQTAADRASQISPERGTLLRMNRRISLKVEDTRLEDVLKFIQDVTQADIEAIWTTDSSSGTGLDKEKKITLNVQNQAALYVLEAVLDKAKTDFAENTWQMTGSGAIQVGPKDVLNKSKRIVIYDINDLLLIIPRYAEVPQIDLNNVLQSNSGGGGGGQSPFTTAGGNNNPANMQPTPEERAKKIMDLLTALVEPTQWQDNGGEGASMHFFNGTLIINAADYIHRQINGYPYWPSGTRQIAQAKGAKPHRWVTLNLDPGISTIEKIRNVPVTAVVGGQGGGGTGTGGGGSGGGSGPPGP